MPAQPGFVLAVGFATALCTACVDNGLGPAGGATREAPASGGADNTGLDRPSAATASDPGGQTQDDRGERTAAMAVGAGDTAATHVTASAAAGTDDGGSGRPAHAGTADADPGGEVESDPGGRPADIAGGVRGAEAKAAAGIGGANRTTGHFPGPGPSH
jgi:hypothetical protein